MQAYQAHSSTNTSTHVKVRTLISLHFKNASNQNKSAAFAWCSRLDRTLTRLALRFRLFGNFLLRLCLLWHFNKERDAEHRITLKTEQQGA